MEKMRKRFGMLLAAALVLACYISLPVKAADGEETTDSTETAEGPYTYTVRIYSGKQGKFSDGSEVKTFGGLTLGDPVNFNINNLANEVVLGDESKYYAKGIRESGKDNSDILANSIPDVERDVDYVVAYGLRSGMVEYTVRFINDATEEKLADDAVYYGNVGDKPVISYLYIEGYQPRAYNLTKTLEADPNENVFTFRYTLLAGAQTDETVIILPGTETSVTEVIPGTGGTNVGTVVVEGNGDAAAGGAAGDGAAGGAGDDGVTIEEPAVPLDTIDLDTMTDEGVYIDEPSVPLSDMKFQLGPIEMDAKRLAIALVVLTAAAAIAIASFLYWGPRRKKEKNDEEDAGRSV